MAIKKKSSLVTLFTSFKNEHHIALKECMIQARVYIPGMKNMLK